MAKSEKSYDDTNLSDEMVITPDDKSELGNAIGTLGAMAGDQAHEILKTFGVKISEIRFDYNDGGSVEVTIKL